MVAIAVDFVIPGSPGPGPLGPQWTGDVLSPMPSGGHHWTPVQTCSLQNPPPRADIWWLLKHVLSVQAGEMLPFIKKIKLHWHI